MNNFLDKEGLKKLIAKIQELYQGKLPEGLEGQVLMLGEDGEVKWENYEKCDCPKRWSVLAGAPSIIFKVKYTTTNNNKLSFSDESKIIEHTWDTNENVGYITFDANGVPSSFFYLKDTLKTVEIIEPCPRISDTVFRGCTSLESVIIPSSVKKIGASAFQNTQMLNEITIPEGITEIPDLCFTGSHIKNTDEEGNITYSGGLKTINLPYGLEKIGAEAFEDCTSLTKVDMPVTVKIIGNRAFQQCDSLTFKNWDFWDNVEELGEKAFQSCHNLNYDTDFEMPVGLKVIPAECFSYSYGFTNIDLGNVEEVGNKAFLSCCKMSADGKKHPIQKIHFPASLKKIGKQAFASDNLADYGSKDKLAYIRINTVDVEDINEYVNIEFGDSKSHPNDYMSEEGIKLTQNGVNLKEINITNENITTIPSYIFAGFNNIEKVTLPESVETIESRAFQSCYGMKSYDFSNLKNLTKIGGYCFASIHEVSGVTSTTSKIINVDEFNFSGCEKLETIMNEAFKNLKIGTMNLSGCDLSSLDSSAFKDCKIENLIMNGAKVESIDKKYNASIVTADFSNCENLANIGEQAFSSCSELETVDLSNCENLTSISKKAFEKTPNLKVFNLSGCVNLKTIGEQAFYAGSNTGEGLRELDLSECLNLETLETKAICHVNKLTVSDTASFLGQLKSGTTNDSNPNLQKLIIKGVNKVAEGLYNSSDSGFQTKITYYVDPEMVEQYKSTYPNLTIKSINELAE